MHNLGIVIGFEFLRTIKKKTFWLSLLAFPLIMVIVFGLSYFSGQQASRAEEEASKERFSMAVLDDSRLVAAPVLAAVEAQAVASKDEGIRRVREGQVEAFVYYPADLGKDGIEIHAKDAGLMKNGKYSAVAEQLLRSSVVSEVGSEQRVAIIQGTVESKLTTYQNGEEADSLKRAIAPGALLVLFYLIIILRAIEHT